jgi:hypothetical protein
MHSLSHGQLLLSCNQECRFAFSLVQTAMRRRLPISSGRVHLNLKQLANARLYTSRLENWQQGQSFFSRGAAFLRLAGGTVSLGQSQQHGRHLPMAERNRAFSAGDGKLRIPERRRLNFQESRRGLVESHRGNLLLLCQILQGGKALLC